MCALSLDDKGFDTANVLALASHLDWKACVQAAAKEYGTAYGREESDNDDDNEIRLETEEDRRRRAMEDMYMDANIPKPEVASQYDWCYCLHAAGVVQLCHCLERLCKQTTLACTITAVIWIGMHAEPKTPAAALFLRADLHTQAFHIFC